MSLNNLAESLKNAVGDLGTLSVETYTGKVGAIVKSDKSIDWDNLLTHAQTAPAANGVKGHVDLVLATHVKIDGDAQNFVTEGEIPQYMIDTHAKAVKNGSEFRRDIINFLGEKVAGIFN